jgi:hypothetical protein
MHSHRGEVDEVNSHWRIAKRGQRVNMRDFSTRYILFTIRFLSTPPRLTFHQPTLPLKGRVKETFFKSLFQSLISVMQSFEVALFPSQSGHHVPIVPPVAQG